MALITANYRDQQVQMHRRPYGGSGWKWADRVQELRLPGESVLDYGCGQGTLGKHCPDILEYDPAIPGKDYPPDPAGLVVCTDVLEHVEPDCLKDVLKDLRRLTLRMAFVVIATRKANKTLPDGRNAHLIIQPPAWWASRLRNAGFAVYQHREYKRPWEKFGECQFKCL